MIDIKNEKVVPLTELAKHVPTRPHVSTLYRWAMRKHDPLETVRIGGRRYSSVEALARFCQQSDSATNAAPTRQRQREIEAANATLDAAGIR